jgi:uncharacterized membrane protein
MWKENWYPELWPEMNTPMETKKTFRERTETWLGNLLLVLQVLLLTLWLSGEKISLPGSLAWTGRLHPLLVHFPITLLILLSLTWFYLNATGKFQYGIHLFSFVMLAAAFLSTLTAIAGYFLAAGGDYDAALLARHRNLGTITAVCAYILWIFLPLSKSTEANPRARLRNQFSLGPTLFSIAFALTTAVMITASHFGGSLTHGEDYLFPGKAVPLTSARVVTDSTSIFEASVRPIFENRCYSCHNEKKSKGNFIMSTAEGLYRGGKNGTPWIAGNPDSSLLVQRLLLDSDNKKHMPPVGKPQPLAHEIELIRYWVQRGADQKVAFHALPAGDSLRLLAEAALHASTPTGIPQKQYDLKANDASVLAKLKSPYYSLQPLYQGSPALQLSFFLKRGFSPSTLEVFEPVQKNIVSLNLSNMPVGDSILQRIPKFSNLEVLNLSGTAITGKALPALSNLRKLEVLSLSGTQVTASELTALAAMPSLRKVFLWQTTVEISNLPVLQKTMPRVTWDLGSGPDPTEKLKLTPPQLGSPDKFIFTVSELLTLVHPMKGAGIRYTTNGSDPDSVGATLYASALPVTGPLTLKTIAVMDGWWASDVKTFHVFSAGIQPKDAKLLTQPDPKYSLQGAQSLFDQQKGEPGNLLVHWLGYREGPMKLQLALDGNREISRIIVSAGISHYSYVFPPLEVEVKAGMDSGHWETVSRIRPVQPVKYGPAQTLACMVPLKKAPWKYLEITVKPLPALPSWHSGKKQKAWVFVDEIFID